MKSACLFYTNYITGALFLCYWFGGPVNWGQRCSTWRAEAWGRPSTVGWSGRLVCQSCWEDNPSIAVDKSKFQPFWLHLKMWRWFICPRQWVGQGSRQATKPKALLGLLQGNCTMLKNLNNLIFTGFSIWRNSHQCLSLVPLCWMSLPHVKWTAWNWKY